MSKKKRIQTGSLTVITDDDEEVEVFMYKDLIEASTKSEPDKWIKGKLVTLITADGYHVHDLGDDRYEILYPITKQARKVSG